LQQIQSQLAEEYAKQGYKWRATIIVLEWNGLTISFCSE
jgi:hypothetical protein